MNKIKIVHNDVFEREKRKNRKINIYSVRKRMDKIA